MKNISSFARYSVMYFVLNLKVLKLCWKLISHARNPKFSLNWYYISTVTFTMNRPCKKVMSKVENSWSVTVLEWVGKVRKESTTCSWTIFPNFRLHKSYERWTWQSTWSRSKFGARISPNPIANTSYENASSCFNNIFISKPANSCYSLCTIYSGNILTKNQNFMGCCLTKVCLIFT